MIMRVRLGVVGCMYRDAEDGVNGCCMVVSKCLVLSPRVAVSRLSLVRS